MQQRPIDLPEFDAPPLVEVVLGTFFVTQKRLHGGHTGLFWGGIREQYPQYEDHPPLRTQRDGQAHRFSLSTSPPMPRAWFIDATGTRLVQLQNDAFLYNWRRAGKKDDYPRFEPIWEKFRENWGVFCRFAEEEQLGKPKAHMGEVTYVNHIPKDEFWPKLVDVSKLIGFLHPTPAEGAEMDSLDCSLQFRDGNERGRLNIQLSKAIDQSTGEQLLRFVLTVRGKLPKPEAGIEANANWYSFAREWIVRSFADMTTEEAHKMWRKTK
jgi:uncharacterized protein (TIGR04255 family)